MQSLAHDKHTLTHSFIENFVPRFVPGSVLVYEADQNGNDDHCAATLRNSFGIGIDSCEKLPSLILHDPTRNWLLLAESASARGPIDERRASQLASLFSKAGYELIYVTAYESRADFANHEEIPAWGSHAWFADEPEHMIHFNGSRFLGPYA